jgi:hypothetical protein
MQLAFHKQMYNSTCQYVNDMEEDLQNCVKTTSKLLTASYTTRSNWPKDLVKLVWRNPFTPMIVRLENPTLGGEWTSCFHCPPWCIFLGSLQSKCSCGFHPKKEMQMKFFYPKKKKLWFFMQRKECSCGFSSKEMFSWPLPSQGLFHWGFGLVQEAESMGTDIIGWGSRRFKPKANLGWSNCD